jgi:hypothetical protein
VGQALAATTLRHVALVLFAALLVVAQQGAATHAIGHASEWLAGSDETDDDGSPHQCPDCARFAAVFDDAPPCDAAPLRFERATEPPARPMSSDCADAPRERPRNRSPPHS